jgi:hypothetical protein
MLKTTFVLVLLIYNSLVGALAGINKFELTNAQINSDEQLGAFFTPNQLIADLDKHYSQELFDDDIDAAPLYQTFNGIKFISIFCTNYHLWLVPHSRHNFLIRAPPF